MMKSYLIVIYIMLNLTIVYSQDTSFVSAENKQLYEIISNLEKGNLVKKENPIILLNKYPLKGFCDQKAYDSLHVILKHILNKYGKVFSSSNEALEEVLHEETPRYDIIFLIFEVSHESTDKSGVPYVIPMGSGMMFGATSGYIHFEIIRFVAIELESFKIVWDYTLKKNASWFSSGNRAKTNEFTDLGRLSDRVGFGDYGKKGVYKLNAELKKYFSKISKSKKSQSHRLY